MAAIKIDTEKNEITFTKGDFYDLKDIEEYKEKILCDEIEDLTGLKNPDKQLAILYKNFYNDRELKGFRAEELFNKYLKEYEIPSLYIGQGLNDMEKAEIIRGLQAKRPDFLVSLPNIGSIFFDVKCRTKIFNSKNGEKVFYLNYDDIEKLNNLTKHLLIPVWIAFIESSNLNSNSHSSCFKVCPVSVIVDYCAKLQANIDNPLGIVLIPNELLSELNDGLMTFSKKTNENLIEKYTMIHRERLDFICEGIFKLLDEKGQINKEHVNLYFDKHKDSRGYSYMTFEFTDMLKVHNKITDLCYGEYVYTYYKDTFPD